MMANGDRIRDHIWIWGHPTNCIGKAPNSNVSPVDGVAYMGAANLYMNEYGDITYDEAKEMELAKDVARLGWCVDYDGTHPNVAELVEYAKVYKNVKIAMFDDFFSPTNPANNFTNYTVRMLREYRRQLHEVGAEMWVVLYTQNYDQVDERFLEMYIKEFDGVSLWFWEEELIKPNFDEFVGKFLRLTEGKKRQIGLYVFNFAGDSEADPSVIEYQLEKELPMLLDGTIDGVIIHTNAVFGMDKPFAAVEACKAWMDKNGDTIIP